jgi:hypothetical protein
VASGEGTRPLASRMAAMVIDMRAMAAIGVGVLLPVHLLRQGHTTLIMATAIMDTAGMTTTMGTTIPPGPWRRAAITVEVAAAVGSSQIQHGDMAITVRVTNPMPEMSA